MTDITEVDLDWATREYIAEMQQQIQTLGISMNAALSLFCRQNKLPGQWRLHEGGCKLIRTDLPEPSVNGAGRFPPQDPADYVS